MTGLSFVCVVCVVCRLSKPSSTPAELKFIEGLSTEVKVGWLMFPLFSFHTRCRGAVGFLVFSVLGAEAKRISKQAVRGRDETKIADKQREKF